MAQFQDRRRPDAGRPWQTGATEALSAIGDAVLTLDATDRLTWANPAAERLLARPVDELVGRTVWEVLPDLRGSELEAACTRARLTRQAQDAEIFSRPLDRWLGGRVHPDPTGALVVVLGDVHERRALDEERAAESSLIRAVLNALPARTAILDADGRILITNTAWEARRPPAGDVTADRGDDYVAVCRAAAAAGLDYARVVADGIAAVLQRRLPSFSLDYSWPARAAGEEGTDTWWHMQAFPVDERPRVVVTHTDVTDRVSAERRAAWQARHDHLTALPNRAALHEVISTALAEDDGRPVTVLYMDVDGFKQVNDLLGHSTGDQLLRELAARLAHRTRPTDVVGRLGGDEFVVVARDCDTAGGELLARRFRAAFDEPFDLGGTVLPVTVSIGIATSDPAHTRPEDLLRDADAAMYAAKTGGRNRHLAFTPSLRTLLDDRWQIASGLRDAADRGQFSLHWQPVVHLASGEVSDCEALLRWEHPQRGLLGPASFVPVAEENGLIVPITRWLLGAATAQAVAWQRRGLALSVAVNVSAVHLAGGTLVDDVLGALADAGLDPRRLTLELTETSLARDPAQATEQFAALREHGVRIAIDDFGTGYSSLSAVASLPVDVLKVDRALVAGSSPVAGRSPATAPEAVLAAVAALGSALHLQVLAEGVETAAQLDLVRRVGCAYAQGHLLSPPLPAEQLDALLEEGRRSTGSLRLPSMTGSA